MKKQAMKNMKRLQAILAAAACVGAAAAQTEPVTVTTTTTTTTTTTAAAGDEDPDASLPPSLFGGDGDELVTSHFSWGADLGTSIDLTTSDMTSVNLHACLGYKSRSIRFLGIGAGINTMMNNSSRSYPVYAMLRTSFSLRPRLCFMDLRLGAVFNNFYEFKNQTDLYSSIGLGITLAAGRRFSSHLVIGYTFMPVRNLEPKDAAPADAEVLIAPRPVPDLHLASIRIGCSF